MNRTCRKRQRQWRQAHCAASNRDYIAAAALAAAVGLILVRHTTAHYQLRCTERHKWLLDIYPSSQRLYGPPRPPVWTQQSPYLAVPTNWTVLDVTIEAVAFIRNNRDDQQD